MIGSYSKLFEIEKSFRMSKSDLQARPIYHRKRDSIEAHLTIVFTALAISRWIEARTGWSIRKFVKTARRCRTIQILAGQHTITAADPLPDDLRQALNAINRGSVDLAFCPSMPRATTATRMDSSDARSWTGLYPPTPQPSAPCATLAGTPHPAGQPAAG